MHDDLFSPLAFLHRRASMPEGAEEEETLFMKAMKLLLALNTLKSELTFLPSVWDAKQRTLAGDQKNIME